MGIAQKRPHDFDHGAGDVPAGRCCYPVTGGYCGQSRSAQIHAQSVVDENLLEEIIEVLSDEDAGDFPANEIMFKRGLKRAIEIVESYGDSIGNPVTNIVAALKRELAQ